MCGDGYDRVNYGINGKLDQDKIATKVGRNAIQICNKRRKKFDKWFERVITKSMFVQ